MAMISWLFQSVKHQHKNHEVSKLINQHFDSFTQLTDHRGCNLLHIVSDYSNLPLLTYLLNSYDQHSLTRSKREWVNLQDGQGNTAVHYAAFRGNLEMVEMLQKHGGDDKLRNRKGLNCMHFAAQGGSALMMYYYKEKGISVDCRDFNANTPLHWAVYAGMDYAVAALLSWGADCDVQDKLGETPLHLAVMLGRLKTLHRLVTVGCDLTLTNNKGLTPYELAQEQGYQNIEPYLRPKSYLCSNACCRYGQSPTKRSTFSLSVIVLLLTLSLNSFSIYLFRDSYNFPIFISAVCLGSLVLLFLITLHFSDPGTIKLPKYDRDGYLLLLTENSPKNICFECQIKKPSRSKHCYGCGKCIRVFDHHCAWVDNCIGTKNVLLFICFLFLTLLYTLITFASNVTGLLKLRQAEMMGKWQIGISVCSGLAVLLSLIVILPLSYLLVRHCRLSAQGISFYEHFQAQRKRKNTDLKLKQQVLSSNQRDPLLNRNIKQLQVEQESVERGCLENMSLIFCQNKFAKEYGWEE